jgi:hypothetical protein
MTAGSVINQKFSVVNPSRIYDPGTVTPTYCDNHIFFQVPCYEPTLSAPPIPVVYRTPPPATTTSTAFRSNM